jgi:hypothetical protein
MWLYQYFRQIIRAAVFQQIGDERHPWCEASVSRHPEFAPRASCHVRTIGGAGVLLEQGRTNRSGRS